MDNEKDTIFEINSVDQDFAFTERVVEVFDDMLDRSIPFYHEVIRATAELLARSLLDGDRVVDLGCATGTTLMELCRLIDNDSIGYLGLDNSKAMLEKAALKAELHTKDKRIDFLEGDITSFELPGTGAFICNYTMQFIRPVQRENFLKRVHENLRPGGLLILGEKIISHDRQFNRIFIDIYHQFKRQKGYSELEIAKKREALENVLIPFSLAENRTLLHNAGFTGVESYFQWFNFVSIVAAKES